MLLSQVCAACHSAICNSLFPSEPLALQEMNSFRSLQEINLYFPSHNSWYLLFSKRNYACLSTINKLNNSLIWNISIFLSELLLCYLTGNIFGVEISCGWHAGNMRVRFGADVVCVSSAHHLHIIWKHACHPHVIWKHVYCLYIICTSPACCSWVKSYPKSHSCVICTLSSWPVPRQKLVKIHRNQTNQSKSQINQTNLLVDLALAPETSKM